MPGEEAIEELRRQTVRYTYGTWRRQRGWSPIHIVDAEGCYFYDSTGKRYLDFSSQLVCCNLGHKNRAVIEAIKKGAEKLAYISPSYSCDSRARLGETLAEIMPPGLTKYFYSTSGTEANEAALKIARLYTRRPKVISRYRSYHGSTAASISVSGEFRRWDIESLGTVPGTIFAPDAYCYRCPLGMSYPECGVACADYVDYILSNDDKVAAMIVEPVVGTNGVLVPPDDYLPKLRRITERYGVLLIADEVMTGWGRTGEWFAVNHWGVVPDMIATAKGVTSSYVPLGVTATSQRVAGYFEDNYFAHGHTYEAHPLALEAALAVIGEYRRLNLIQRARVEGEYLGKRLRELMDRHESVGDVRGLGLFWAVELVRNRDTKQPFNTPLDKYQGKPLLIDRLAAEAMKQGVSVMGWVNYFVVAPPLIIEREEIDRGVEVLSRVLEIADEEARRRS